MKYFISHFLERKISPQHFLWFQRIFLLALSIQLIVTAKQFSNAIRQRPHYNALPLIEWISALRPEPLLFDSLRYVLIGVLLLAAAGLFSRFLLPLALMLAFWVFGVELGLDKSAGSDYVSHTKNLCIFLLLIFAVAPPKTDRIWPLTLVRLSLALVYFGSAITRLKNSGLGWMDGYTLRAFLYEHAYLLELPDTLWLAEQHGLCVFLSWLIMLFELSFVFFVLHPKWSLIFAVGGLLFHFSTLHFMQINFFPFHSLAYLVFLVGGMGTRLAIKDT